jgi:hypothetical protein
VSDDIDTEVLDAIHEHSEEPPTDDGALTIVIQITPNGFGVSIPDSLNPITLAGVAWYLEEMASVGLVNQARANAAAEAKKPNLVVMDHLPKRKNHA